MSGPPANLTAAELWSQITQAPRQSREVDFPRTKDGTATGGPICTLRMWVLTQAETEAASAETEKRVRKALADSKANRDEPTRGYEELYNQFAAVELLFRACRMAEDLKAPFFPQKAWIEQHLTTDEVAVLVNQYMVIKGELGPIVAELSEEETEAWIEKLREGGRWSPLGRLSWGALTTLLRSMASRLPASPTDSSSLGMPLDETSKTTSSDIAPETDRSSTGA